MEEAVKEKNRNPFLSCYATCGIFLPKYATASTSTATEGRRRSQWRRRTLFAIDENYESVHRVSSASDRPPVQTMQARIIACPTKVGRLILTT